MSQKFVSRGRQPHLPARGTPLPRGTRPERMCVAASPVAARTHRGQILKTLTTRVAKLVNENDNVYTMSSSVSVDSRFADVKLLSRPTEAPIITMAVTGMVTDRGVEVMVNVYWKL